MITAQFRGNSRDAARVILAAFQIRIDIITGFSHKTFDVLLGYRHTFVLECDEDKVIWWLEIWLMMAPVQDGSEIG